MKGKAQTMSKFESTDTGVCGTRRGYQMHYTANEYPCSDCVDANTQYTRAHHIISGRRLSMQLPIEVIRVCLIQNPHDGIATFIPDIIKYAIVHGHLPEET